MTHKEWEKEVKKALIDREENQSDMADALGLSRQYVCAVINGTIKAPRAIGLISDYCGLEAYVM